MNRIFPRTLLVGLLAFGTTVSVSAQESNASLTAKDVVLSSGQEGGGYWSAAKRLQSVASKRADLAVEVLPSAGSLENMEKILDDASPVNLAFSQADAAQSFLDNHPGQIEKLDLLESIGQECVFIVTSSDSEIRNEKDLRAATDLRLGISSATSGVAVTFDYMKSEIPDMGDISVVYGDTLQAMKDINAPDATVDAVMMVHRPRAHSPEVEYALANSDQYRFVELNDEMFLQSMWNGSKIYRTMNLAMPEPSEPVKTLCMRGVLLANKQKLTIEQRNKLSDLMLYHWMEIYPTQ
ncbi:Uncharacterised protein [Halioglobus japonicus]|nr:Uncharacterised protein [Halioglobus japonicus]